MYKIDRQMLNFIYVYGPYYYIQGKVQCIMSLTVCCYLQTVIIDKLFNTTL